MAVKFATGRLLGSRTSREKPGFDLRPDDECIEAYAGLEFEGLILPVRRGLIHRIV